MDLPNPAELRAIAARYQAVAGTIERIQQLRSQASHLSQQADELEASLPSAPQAAQQPAAPAPSAPSLQDHVQADWEQQLRTFDPSHWSLPENQPSQRSQ